MLGNTAGAHPAEKRKQDCQTTRCHKRVKLKRHFPYCNTWRCIVKAKRRELRRRARFLSPLARCIIRSESGGNPLAQNGQYKGIAQWSPEAWRRHGGLRYASTPHGATYAEQVQVLKMGLARYGCRDWCPFDPC